MKKNITPLAGLFNDLSGWLLHVQFDQPDSSFQMTGLLYDPHVVIYLGTLTNNLVIGQGVPPESVVS